MRIIIRKTAFVLYFILCSICNVCAQNISGIVVHAALKTPLSGALVVVNTTGQTATTSELGAFTINAKPNDVLEISLANFITKRVTVTNTANYSIELAPTTVSNNDQLIIVGSRRAGRVKLETAVPVDVIKVQQNLLPTARMDLTSLLNYAAPSFNYNKQSGSDGADHIDLATLRGLGPDQTLVLINGKRRHQTSFIAVYGSRGRGNSGTDLSAIPAAAIDRVEILRDGASAQYGSDAIAGVINIILKKDVNIFTGSMGVSGYLDNTYNPAYNKQGQYADNGKLDGPAFNVNGNVGFAIGKKPGGFVNITVDALTQGKTYRQVLENDPNNDKALPVNYVRRNFGDASMAGGSMMYNMELPGKRNTFYSSGSFTSKLSNAYAYTREYSNGSANPRFVTNKFGRLVNVPGIIKTTSDGVQYYNPEIETQIIDGAITVGLKGVTKRGLNWDVSNALGNNSFDFYGKKTFNASLNDPFKNSFDDGGFSLLQNTVNANFSKEINTVASGLNLAFGAEYRHERYKLHAGEEASWKNYNSFVLDSVFDDNNVFQQVDTVYRNPGAQGFVGFQPADVTNDSRNVLGAYVDAELDITKNVLIDLAARVENYSDFGTTFNAKLATRLKASKNFSIRGSVSTGYRAPSLAQINYSSTFTNVSGGQIFDVKIASNKSNLTRIAGINELKQERSLNASLGFTTKPIQNLSITIDAYWVRVKDRIVLSGAFSSTNADLQYNTALINALNTLNVSQAQFFANAVNTTNSGIDVVIDYSKKLGKGTFKALFAGNIQRMKVDDINYPTTLSNNNGVKEVFFSKREQQYLISSAPPTKFALSLDYSQQKFSIGTRLTQFGKITLFGFGENFDGLNPVVPLDNNPSVKVEDKYIYKAKLTVDVYASAKLTKNTSLFFGCDNILNTHPDLGYVKGAKAYAFNTEGGGAWDLVQMGINGRRVFMKLGISL